MIYTRSGTLLASKCTRIVRGKRGDYVEIDGKNIEKGSIYIPPGSEWRLKTARRYYIEYRTRNDGMKVYFQQEIVKYADYKKFFYYVSLGDVFLNDECQHLLPKHLCDIPPNEATCIYDKGSEARNPVHCSRFDEKVIGKEKPERTLDAFLSRR